MIASVRLIQCMLGTLLLCVFAIGSSEALSQSLPAPQALALSALERFRDPHPLVIAHRGCRRGAPENSLASINACIRKGIDVAELDIRQTRDGALVLMHDETMERTTNLAGPLLRLSLAELQTARLRATAGDQALPLTKEGVPTLAQALRAAKGRLILLLDIKCSDCEQAVIEQVEAEKAQDWVLFVGTVRVAYRTGWVRDHTFTWISDCRMQRLYPDMVPCFRDFATGVGAFGPDWPQLFVASSRDFNFYSNSMSDAALRGIKPLIGVHIRDRRNKSEQAILAEMRSQWEAYLLAGPVAFMEDYPDELMEFLKQTGRR